MKLLAAALAAVLTTSSATAAVRLSRDAETSSLVALTPPPPVAPSASPTPTSVSTPELKPTPTPTPTSMSVSTPAPKPVVPVVRTAPTLPASVLDFEDGPASPPYAPGRWRAVAHGVTVDVTLDPAVPRAGEMATFTVRMASKGTQCCLASLSYSDSGIAPELDQHCDTTPPPATSRTLRFRHAFRHPGTAKVLVSVVSYCGHRPGAFAFTAGVPVADGPLLSNGPWQAFVQVAATEREGIESPAPGQYFRGDVFDPDGAPWSWSWDFGDGTTPPVQPAPGPCFFGDGNDWPKRMDSTSTVAHRYAKPGTYTIRFTATTAGCDGEQPQTVSATMRWTVAD